MSQVTETLRSSGRVTIPAHTRGLGGRVLASFATPGGAVFLLVLALVIAIAARNENFSDPGVLIRFIGRTAPIAIAAMGQYFVIVAGEFDLSMAAVVSAQVVMAGNLIGQDADRILPVTLLMLAIGALIGLVNGLATTLLQVPSFIVTLGMMLALGGLVSYLTGGAATGNPVDEFRQIGRGAIEDVPVVDVIPYPLVIFAVLAVLASWLVRRPFGKSLIAAGDNERAADVSGTSVWWLKTRAFMLSSLSATVAGIILVGYAGVHPSVGQGYEFTAITAVVLGGVLLGGGRGWVLSAAAGAFALELLFTLLTTYEVASTWRDTVQGLIIIVAVAAGGRAWQAGRRPRRTSRSTSRGASPAPASHALGSTTPPPAPGTDQRENN
jgi:ribose transport system permease protein